VEIQSAFVPKSVAAIPAARNTPLSRTFPAPAEVLVDLFLRVEFASAFFHTAPNFWN
jgi:hypothetical protein